jgi:uncharacterized RDD family membrane protein YckC
VEYEDRITIAAPEGIELEYTLAGLGSRFIAAALDTLLRIVVLGAAIALAAVLGASSTALIVMLSVGVFLALFAYPVAFEVWGGGRTPGKRWSGLRVLMASGQPVAFGASAVRTLLLIVDVWATVMIAGTVSVIWTRRNQRLGDLAAGTIVVRERRDLRLVATADAVQFAVSGIDVTAVTASELATIRDFLGRRERLTPDARGRVSRTLADRVAGRIGGIEPGSMPPERLLETIVAAKAAGRVGGGISGTGTDRYGSPGPA